LTTIDQSLLALWQTLASHACQAERKITGWLMRAFDLLFACSWPALGVRGANCPTAMLGIWGIRESHPSS
jgi:hypothetical protein